MKTFTLTMTRTYETIFEVEADSVSDAIANLYKNNDRYAVELEQCCVIDEKIECIKEDESAEPQKYAIVSTWNGEGYSYLNTAEVLEFKNDEEAQKHLRRLFETQQDAEDYEVTECNGLLQYGNEEDSGSYFFLKNPEQMYGLVIYCNVNDVHQILNAKEWRNHVAAAIKQAEPEEVSEIDLTEKTFFIPAYNSDYDYQFIKF
jgi:hypothetical protein